MAMLAQARSLVHQDLQILHARLSPPAMLAYMVLLAGRQAGAGYCRLLLLLLLLPPAAAALGALAGCLAGWITVTAGLQLQFFCAPI